MLKIKDDVPLEELEKFGFKRCDDKVRLCKYVIDNSEQLHILSNRYIRLFVDDEYYYNWTSGRSFDLIYDLIQAGLVEKKEDI